MGRFTDKEMPSTGLDAILYDDFEELGKIRVLEDQGIENFMSNLS